MAVVLLAGFHIKVRNTPTGSELANVPGYSISGLHALFGLGDSPGSRNLPRGQGTG